MNLLNEIVAAAVKGVDIPFKVSGWTGSQDGHASSVVVNRANAFLSGPQMEFSFVYTVMAPFANAGPHTLAGRLVLPHGPATVLLDDSVVPDGRLVILPHLKGRAVRLEALFYCPEAGNPLHHLRFDGDLARA